MAFYDDLLAVFDKYSVGLPPHLAQQLYNLHVPGSDAPVQTPDLSVGGSHFPPTLPAGCDWAFVPGQPVNALVRLTAVSGYWGTIPMAIEEIAELCSSGSPQRVFLDANIGYANIEYSIGEFIPACHEVDNGTLNTTKPLAGTQALPSKNRTGDYLKTVAQAIAHFSALAEPVTSNGAGFGA